MNKTAMWKAVAKRDKSSDGQFVFAVRTTGIYCRPSCPARRPDKANVQFFDTRPGKRVWFPGMQALSTG